MFKKDRASETFCAFFNMVMTTNLPNQDNVQIAYEKCTLKIDCPTFDTNLAPMVVRIPYLTNSKQLKAGTFLMRTATVTASEPSSKRAKKS